MLRLKRSSSGGAQAELRKVLGRFELPMIPAVVTQALGKIMDPECDLRQVAEIIERDPGLSARLLSISNSAAYAPRSPIVAVPQAVVMLGRNQVESLLITLAASAASHQVAPSGFDLKGFWLRSAWKAATADALSAVVDRRHKAENLTAALLEDIAIPVLLRCQPRFKMVLQDWYAGEGSLADLTRGAFGWTHRTVAGWMFEDWDFPEDLIEAVTEEGDPETDDLEFPVVRLVSSLGAPGATDGAVQSVAEKVAHVFNMEPVVAQTLIERSRITASSLAQALA